MIRLTFHIVRLAVLGFIISLMFMRSAATQAVCADATGKVERQAYRSQIAQTNMVYSVYTPPCYQQSDMRYPVVYLLHGSNEDDKHWLRLGLGDALNTGIADGSLPPMIVVMPFGEWIANKNQFERVSWEDVFLQELLPLTEKTYRTDGRRAIGGVSRGGFWAFEIAFRHPEMFVSVGGHSAFFDLRNAPPDYNPLDLALNAPGIHQLRIWLDHGLDDYARQNLDLMHERLNQRGIQHQYMIYPEGQHNNAYWSQHVGDYLRFYGAAWHDSILPSTPIVLATNTPQTTATTEATQSPSLQAASHVYMFVPAVSFFSTQSSLTGNQLRAIANGRPDKKLVLDTFTAEKLKAFNIAIAPDTMIVPDAALEKTLWRNRSLYTLLPFDRLTPRYRILYVDGGNLLDTDLTAYPLAFASDRPNYNRGKLTRILLSGVTALTRLTTQAIDAHSIEWAGEAIKPYANRADFFHTSNEVSFTPDCPKKNALTIGEFCSKEAHFGLLPYIGVNVVELTGNHNNDFGTDAYLQTLAYYHRQNISTIGGGANLNDAQKPLLLDHHGNKIAWVACNWAGPQYALATKTQPGAAYCDWNWLKATLPALSKDNDLLLVTVQYKEYEQYQPTPEQERDFRALADLGADVVIGTQAHKPQTFAFYQTTSGQPAFIHYGLGNLFFDQPFWGNSRFFMDQLYIYEGRLLNIDLFTGIIEDNARPRPMNAEERQNFLVFMFNTQGAN